VNNGGPGAFLARRRNRTGTPCLGSPQRKERYAQGTSIDCIAPHDRAPGFRTGPIVIAIIDREIIPNRSDGIDQEGDSGSTAAQFQLGLAYQLGQGVDQDTSEAIRWYRMAANNGDPSAQNNLGYLYKNDPKQSRISRKRPNGTCAQPYLGTPRPSLISGFFISAVRD